MTREEFFTLKENAAKWDVAVAIHRTNPLPIDNDAVFGSLEDAQAFALSPTAYPGQIVAVVTDAATTMYYLDYDTDKTKLKLVAFSGDVQSLTARVAALEATMTTTFKDTEIVEIFGGNAAGWTEE